MIDISGDVQKLVPKEMVDGVCNVFSKHTTVGITINENADPDVFSDILSHLEEMVPARKISYKHGEGNSDSHIKTSLVGVSQTIPVRNGRLCLGTWQGVCLCEFDGPRDRAVEITFLK
jgi:secondary thiamine-phosphate synthase enzyme